MPDKKYTVGNPNGIPEGTRILVTAEKEFYEGDAIELADLKDDKDLTSLIKQGYVVEVKAKRGKAEEVTDAG